MTADRLKRVGTLLFSLSLLFMLAILWSCGGAKPDTKASIAAGGAKVSVSVVKPQWTTQQEIVTVNGEIHAKDEVQVVAETSGKVTSIKFDAGTKVEEGDILATMEDEVKQANLASAQASNDKAKADLDRGQQLFAAKVISDADLQTYKLAYVNANAQLTSVQKDFDNTRVRSPISGVVTERNVSVGTMLTPGVPVARVINISQLKLLVSISENNILKLKKGQQVSIEADSYPCHTFTGTVFAISPKSSSSLTFPVEIDLRNDGRYPLYDGMLATAKIALGKRSMWTIPRISIVGSLQKPQVFVVMNGVALLKDIVVGSEFGLDNEVIKGLDQNDQVITNGQNNLDDGSMVEIIAGDKQ